MTSMLYTIGTALNRAADNGLTVSVLVEGSWLQGQVAASDGMGVVLEGSDGEHAVVRTERIAAVRMHPARPQERPTSSSIARGPEVDFTDLGAARPMPGPQAAYA